MPRPHRFLTATSRAARLVAGMIANTDDYQRPIHEARSDEELRNLALALGARCVDLATELYGDRAQEELDRFAFACLNYETRNGGALT